MEPQWGPVNKLNLRTVLEALKCLITPSDTQKDIEDINSVFHASARNAIGVLGIDNVKIPLCRVGDSGSSETWEFVEVALFILSFLKNSLSEDLSVSHIKNIRSVLQFIVSLGLCPSLLPGVGIPLSCRSVHLQKLKVEDTSVLCKYERLCHIVKSLLFYCENRALRPLIIENVFEDLLAGLIQLSFAPLKKPQGEMCDRTSHSDFTMSHDLWQRFKNDQTSFKHQLWKLINETYQPTVMAKLMILQGGKEQCCPPFWMKKTCSSLLTECLVRPDGVAALIRATFDSALDVGADWEKVEVLARLITSPLNHLDKIADQLFILLKRSESIAPHVFVVVMACVKELMIKEAALCQKLIVNPLLFQFQMCCFKDVPDKSCEVVLNEDNLLSSFNCIYKCFLTNVSEVSSYSLPASLLVPCISFLFNMYCKVNGSACVLCAQVERLLFQILSCCDSTVLKQVLQCLLFLKGSDKIPVFSINLCFTFGPCGGVQVEQSAQQETNLMNSSIEDIGDNMIILLEHQDSNHHVSLSVFVALLSLLVDIGLDTSTKEPKESRLDAMEDTLSYLISSSQKQLGIVRMLAVLAEKENVQTELTKDPTVILNFLLSLLESAKMLIVDTSNDCESDDSGLQCVFLSLMILNILLEKCHENTNWLAFKELLPPIAVICDRANDAELCRLASNVYTTIATHGVIRSSGAPSKDSEVGKTRCENALHDSCDPLLPVRGHALVELTKLLWEHEQETISKKDAVYCILQENLKSDDSFVYLAAINGMVAFAAIEPDCAVKSLIQEYMHSTTAGDSSGKNADLRMKIGEVLVKLMRVLGEMAPHYKNELLNAFLVGVKDADHLMRASSLSNLGEICRILGFRVGPILQEILICIEGVAKFDKALEPRRASVMVITQLIQGLGDDTISVLQEVLRDLYHSLKHISLNDDDDVVRLHAQLALVELDTAVRSVLFPKLKLEKKVLLL